MANYGTTLSLTIMKSLKIIHHKGDVATRLNVSGHKQKRKTRIYILKNMHVNREEEKHTEMKIIVWWSKTE